MAVLRRLSAPLGGEASQSPQGNQIPNRGTRSAHVSSGQIRGVTYAVGIGPTANEACRKGSRSLPCAEVMRAATVTSGAHVGGSHYLSPFSLGDYLDHNDTNVL